MNETEALKLIAKVGRTPRPTWEGTALAREAMTAVAEAALAGHRLPEVPDEFEPDRRVRLEVEGRMEGRGWGPSSRHREDER